MRKVSAVFLRALMMTVVLSVSVPARADIDITAFAGAQRQGKLTLQSAPGTASNLIRIINATTFGVFGARIAHGKVFGGEHTLAFSSNFIDSETKAFIYNSNLLVQAPLPVVKPYGTAGLGLIHTSGDGVGVFGTGFAINYGGGVKFLPAGPVGVRIDVRGYTVPSAEFRVFEMENKNINFVEASFGIVFVIRK